MSNTVLSVTYFWHFGCKTGLPQLSYPPSSNTYVFLKSLAIIEVIEGNKLPIKFTESKVIISSIFSQMLFNMKLFHIQVEGKIKFAIWKL